MALSICAPTTRAEPGSSGQTGLVNMPDARVEADGTFRFGASNADPYFTLWGAATLLPRLQLSGRYTTIDGVPGFANKPELGDYKDKAFDAKVLLSHESELIPAVSLGSRDIVGTQLFHANFIAFSKRIADFDVSIGYGDGRLRGFFGGVRYAPAWWRELGFVLEYDANDYQKDISAERSGAGARAGGVTYAVEYRYGWLGSQLSYQGGEVGANVYLSIPLMQREFIAKIDEPGPYTAVTSQPDAREWRDDPRRVEELARALDRHGFTDIGLQLTGDTLHLTLSHPRISLLGRAVGRATRIALLRGPRDLAALSVTCTENGIALVTYRLENLPAVRAYFAGTASSVELENAVTIHYASTEDARRFRHEAALVFGEPQDATFATSDRLRFDKVTPFLHAFTFAPFSMRVFFNDPGEPFRYDTFSALSYSKQVWPGLFVNGIARLTLFENVSDITQVSNSLLPHVRTDIAEYKRKNDRLRVETLLANKYWQPFERVYTRWSAGYYEEMFGGVGTQWLYLPQSGNWAADIAVDRLTQRAPGENLGFRAYTVTTALVSLHYRFPDYGVTTTARFGRFLAKDEGVRLELKRRFRSGVELGFWYTRTNEDDITNPGTPEHPYRDKGVFLSVPLGSMLTRDSRERANLALADYTRDVGQMVVSPGDLYRLAEGRLLLDSAEHGPLVDFSK